jgi:hypothetical protein
MIISFLKISFFLDMLNLFSIKNPRPGDAQTNDVGTQRTSAAILRVTKGYFIQLFHDKMK